MKGRSTATALGYWVARSSPTVCTHLYGHRLTAKQRAGKRESFQCWRLCAASRSFQHRWSSKLLILSRFLRCVNHVGHSPRNGFNGFLRALPGDQACLTPSPALLLTDLTPASGRQNHTTSPSASAPF